MRKQSKNILTIPEKKKALQYLAEGLNIWGVGSFGELYGRIEDIVLGDNESKPTD